MLPERPVPTKAEVESYLRDRRNWGRWGADDQVGAVNLITAEKRLRAAALVRSGRAVSLSREFPKTPAPNNPTPAQHFMHTLTAAPAAPRWTTTASRTTARPAPTSTRSATSGTKTACGTGAPPPTRSVLRRALRRDYELVERHHHARRAARRPAVSGEPFVTQDRPIHGWELEDVAKAQGVTIEPGDALVVYGGREAWDRVNPIWGSGTSRPGLHASCCRSFATPTRRCWSGT